MAFGFKNFVAITLLVTSVGAHVKMIQPVAYSADTLTNAPLQADGSDFPCKLRPNPWELPDKPNDMKVGEPQTLSLEGSAVHGGGSCQISLTTDMHPSKSSKWMVIKSIEGGCPANVPGNLPGTATSVVNTFNYTIPNGIGPGKYTLAWSWFNRIGDREMYMNCAPVNIQAASSSKRSEVALEVEPEADAEPRLQSKEVSKRSEFPPLFVANINGCNTKAGIDIRFPDPGNVLEFHGDADHLEPVGEPACTGTPRFGAAGMEVGGNPSTSKSPADGPKTSTVALSIPAHTGLPEPPAPPKLLIPTPSPGSSSSSSRGETGSCNSEGIWNCIDGSSFQRCANGQWTVVQSMAPGTKCTPGQSQDFIIAAINARDVTNGMRRRRSSDRIHV